jgi:ParB-like chromosome segregation protein Spo0J
MAKRRTRKLLDTGPVGIGVQPVTHIEWVDPLTLTANDYNPNHVAPPELELLRTSMIADGWTQPLVATAQGEIVDGFHRWTLAQRDPAIATLGSGLVPVARLDAERGDRMAATIRHNRARGQHAVRPMAAIVRELVEALDYDTERVCTILGMESEEVERLLDHSGMLVRGSSDEFGPGWKPGHGDTDA